MRGENSMALKITETKFGSLRALAIESANSRVVVALRGVTVISWAVDGVELIDGYADEQEFNEQTGMRSAMMIPFSNRIDNGRYHFDGHEIDFHAEDSEHAGEIVMHGMLRIEDFAITGKEVAEDYTTVRFASRALRPGVFPGYPFSVDVTIDMTVTNAGLEFMISGNNVGATAAPFASGWHPYFRIGSAPIASLAATIPAETRIVPDARLIPIEGDGAFEPVSGEWDFREAKRLESQVIDMAFSDLVPAADCLIHSTLTDPVTGRTIDAWQERGLMHAFTADTVTRPRGSFAMESVEVMTNAVNRLDRAAAIRLEPGTCRTFRFGATAILEKQ